MKVLHLLRSEPEETVEKLTDVMSEENTTTVVSLYEPQIDWLALIDQIFENDRVVCWW
jgi:hypothetical protein